MNRAPGMHAWIDKRKAHAVGVQIITEKATLFFSLSFTYDLKIGAQITNLAMAMTDETGKGWRRPYDCGK
jgi:hypothetical protein